MDSTTVDSYRFLDPLTRQVVKTWIAHEKPRAIPWTPLARPLSECRVALLSSGGIALKSDRPFDQECERANPWQGDPSYRVLPRTVHSEDIRVYHLHINPALGEQDVNVLLPAERLLELEAAGEIGRAAGRHYSLMGYLPQPEAMLAQSVPAIVQQLRDERVDVLVLVPA